MFKIVRPSIFLGIILLLVFDCHAFLPTYSPTSVLMKTGCHSRPRVFTTHRIHQPHVNQKISATKLKGSFGPIPDAAKQLAASLFEFHGNVPFLPSLGWNVFWFTLLRKKLLKMLTPQGYLHAIALGTGLWTTLGWRGWTLCVAYLFLGQAGEKAC